MIENAIQIFECEQFGQIRTMVKDGEPWFVGKDVAEVLGYSNASKAIIMHVDDDDKNTMMLEAHSQNGNLSMTKTTIINESGLYALILSSKLPKAREFKHWVTSVVLPQIRQTGGYIPVNGNGNGNGNGNVNGNGNGNGNGNDDDAEIMARALMIAQKTIELKDALIEAQKPKVMFAEAVTACDDSILIRDLAKLITQNGVKIGQGRLFYWLRVHGYLFKNETRPIQKWVEKGLFETNVTLIHTHHGTKERCTTKVTGKGQEYFVNGFLSGRFRPCPLVKGGSTKDTFK